MIFWSAFFATILIVVSVNEWRDRRDARRAADSRRPSPTDEPKH
jgi:1,4-dihydroxy-2-naphthoate octaprenyltransferase